MILTFQESSKYPVVQAICSIFPSDTNNVISSDVNVGACVFVCMRVGTHHRQIHRKTRPLTVSGS